MHVIVFGEMGMCAEEYYNMLHKDFAAKMEGYEKRLYRERNDLRKAAFLGLMPWLAKGYTEARFRKEVWPLAGDENEDEIIFDPVIEAELYKQILQENEAFIEKINNKQ